MSNLSKPRRQAPQTRPYRKKMILALNQSNGYNASMPRKRKSLSDEIRAAVDASDMSRYRICKIIGISESTFSRFMAGGWLGQEYMNALADLLDLHVKTGKRKTKKGR